MRLMSFRLSGIEGLAIVNAEGVATGWTASDAAYPGSLDHLVSQGPERLKHALSGLANGRELDLDNIEVLPVLSNPGKIICVGLNYADHPAESGFKQPDYPTLFGRFNSSLIGHGAPIVRPRQSEQLDYEGELAAVIGIGGKNIPPDCALDHVLGYSIFNDASIRDYQFKTPQWTMGKNFDNTGPFGPALVTTDELPPGCKGLKLVTRLNGQVVQSAMIDDMVFDVATQRKPPLWMKPSDVCEVEIDQVGLLRNPIIDEDEVAEAQQASSHTRERSPRGKEKK